MKDPAKHEAALSDLVAARDAVVAEQRKLADLQDKRNRLIEDQRAFEQERLDVAATKAALAADREVLNREKHNLKRALECTPASAQT